MQIKIYLDGTFEAVAAAVDLKVLRKDLSIARKIAALRSTAVKKATAMKKARATDPSSKAAVKLGDDRGRIMAEIKHLITTLSNKTHANLQTIGKKYAKHQQVKVKLTPSKVVRKPKAVQDTEYDPWGVIHGEEELERLEDLVFQLKTRMTRFDNIIRSEPGPKKLANARDEVKKLGKELMTAESDLEKAEQNLHRIHH